MHKKILLFAIPDLEGLGVQHDILTLYKYWPECQWEIQLLVHSRTGEFANKFPLEFKSVHVDDFLIFNFPKLRVLERLFFGYRRAINSVKPHAVISFVPMSNYGCFFAKAFGKWKFGLAVSEHAHVSGAMLDPSHMSGSFIWFYRKTFSRIYNSSFVNQVKCIADESMRDLIENHGIKPNKTRRIYNPIPINELIELAKYPVEYEYINGDSNKPFIFVNSGRLVSQKRQDLLIKAFAICKAKFDNTFLIIMGKGDPKELAKLASELGVLDRVLFAGHQTNPWKWVSKSDVFVLSSSWEGLPCVLTETQAIRIPIISFTCPSGPREILMEGKAGVLCEAGNLEELANSMMWAVENKNELKKFAEVAYQNIDRFEPVSIAHEYAKLADDISR